MGDLNPLVLNIESGDTVLGGHPGLGTARFGGSLTRLGHHL